ncbi:MAG: 5-bromo-4-chloroindolyl phosphate hydrolysis family protein [Clostridia bacterium]|nr:5-bromo-4-chloroindolyl phosphate hydrolysis family protein [Clostridia bacterium]
MKTSKAGCSVGFLVAAAIFIIILFAFKNLIWWMLGILIVFTISASIMLVAYNSKQKKMKKRFVTEGVTEGDIDRFISESNLRLQSIRRNYYKLRDDGMRNELDLISDRCKQISKIIKDDPADFKAGRRFINLLLTSLERITQNSVRIFESSGTGIPDSNAIANASESLALLRVSAENQINKFNQNNILEIDVELEVLKKTLAARGLLDDKINNAVDKEQEGEPK